MTWITRKSGKKNYADLYADLEAARSFGSERQY
jgi:hypothetical protein